MREDFKLLLEKINDLEHRREVAGERNARWVEIDNLTNSLFRRQAQAFDWLINNGLLDVMNLDVPGELEPLAYQAYDFAAGGDYGDFHGDVALGCDWIRSLITVARFVSDNQGSIANMERLLAEASEWINAEETE